MGEREDIMPQTRGTIGHWPRRRLLELSGVAATVAVVVALLITLGLFTRQGDAGTADAGEAGAHSAVPRAQSAPPETSVPEARPAVELSRVFAEVSRRVRGAVVNISTERVLTPEQTPLNEFFERFFGGPLPEQHRRSVGSGVIVSEDGHILTNHHVVDGAEEIEVQLVDQATSLKARLLGSDPPTDLAVLEVPSDAPLPVAPLGDSDRLEVGEWVLAIGNPFGVGQTVTAGIISATGRVIGQGPYDDFVQTDAAINPGNSGGPLVNMAGEVIGINSNIVSRNGGNMGIGFAIPSSMASNIYDQIVRTGGVTRGWLGVTIQNLTPELARSFGIEGRNGALVSQIRGEDSPAKKAGLEAGDVIVAFNGKPVDSSRDLTRQVADAAPGETVDVVYFRDGERKTTEVTLGKRETTRETATEAPGARGHSRLGIRGRDLTPQLAAQIGTQSTSGVVVAGVEPGSPAADAGLQRGDIIHEANRQDVRSMSDLQGVIKEVKKGGSLLLRIERVQGGTSGFLYLPVTLDGEDDNG
jgi:serine protease Do